MDDTLENRARAVIRARMKGRRNELADAAGHSDGSWVSNWLAGRQKHATLGEIAAMLKRLDVGWEEITGAADPLTARQVATLKLAARIERLPDQTQARLWRIVELNLQALEETLAQTHAAESSQSPRPVKNAAKR